MRFQKTKSFFMMTGLALFVAGPSLAKNCDAILAQGLRDTYSFTDNSSFDRAIHNSICSNRSSRSSSSNNFGVNIPLVEIGQMLGFNASDTNARSKVDEYCREFDDTLNRQAAVAWTRSVVSSDIVRAWENCEAEKGFRCELEPRASNDVSLRVFWSRTNVGPGTEAAVVSGPLATSNVDCPASVVPPGTAIVDDTSVAGICQIRDNGLPATVIINSSQGPATCVAEAPAPEMKSADFVEDCVGGSELACLGLLQDVGVMAAKCDRMLNAPAPTTPEGSRTRFWAYINCGNMQTGVSAIRTLTDDLQAKCFGPVMVRSDCDNAKQALRSSAAMNTTTMDEIIAMPEPQR